MHDVTVMGKALFLSARIGRDGPETHRDQMFAASVQEPARPTIDNSLLISPRNL
jgi:hypothetical protein